MRRMAVVTLGLLSLVLPARAGEIVEFKGAVLVRQEERAMMVFKVKNGEIKALVFVVAMLGGMLAFELAERARVDIDLAARVADDR